MTNLSLPRCISRHPWQWFALSVSVLLIILRFLHLEADFPYREAKSGDIYTDEGTSSNAASAYVLTHNWYVESDFNPAVNVPVFPMLQTITFQLLGLNLFAARTTNLILLIITLIILTVLIKKYADSDTAIFSVLLICINYNCFTFSRLALLEMPMVFFIVLSIAIASIETKKHQWYLTTISAIMLLLAILSKNYALFALPILLFFYFFREHSFSWRLTQIATFGLVFVFGLTVYFLIMVKPHLQDFHTYYNTNIYTKTQGNFFLLVRGIVKAFYYGRYTDLILFPITMIYAIILFRTWVLRRNLLFWICCLWITAYIVLIGTQNYVPPRYYTAVVIPLAVLSALIFRFLIKHRKRSILTKAFIAAIVLSMIVNGHGILKYISYPSFTWLNMTYDVKKQIERDKCAHPILLGTFATSITLSTGIFALNDELGTEDLDYKISKYLPNYYVCLGVIKPKISRYLDKYYYSEKVSQYDVYGNYYTGEPVVLYRLIPKNIVKQNLIKYE